MSLFPRHDARRAIGDVEREFQLLVHRYAGVVQQHRLQTLADRLAHGPALAVIANRCGFAGDRWHIWLADGSGLYLKLYWPQRARLAVIGSLEWSGDSWDLGARATDGRWVTLKAFRAAVELPHGSALRRTRSRH